MTKDGKEMIKDGKKVVIGLVTVGALTGGIIVLTRKAKAAPPPGPGEPIYQLTVYLIPETESPEPGVIYTGGVMGIYGDVLNVGTAQGTYIITFYVNGEQVHQTQNTINPVPARTEPQSNRYLFHVPAIDIYTIDVAVNGITATTSFAAIEAPPGEALIRAASDDPLAYMVIPGKVHANIALWNDGDGTGEYVVDWYLDNTIVQSDNGILSPGAYMIHYLGGGLYSVGRGSHTLYCLLRYNDVEVQYPTMAPGYKTFISS